MGIVVSFIFDRFKEEKCCIATFHTYFATDVVCIKWLFMLANLKKKKKNHSNMSCHDTLSVINEFEEYHFVFLKINKKNLYVN